MTELNRLGVAIALALGICAIGLCILTMGCGGPGVQDTALLDATVIDNSTAQPVAQRVTADSFTLDVLAATAVGGELHGDFSLTLNDTTDELVVKIEVADADGLAALICNLQYDATRYTPVAATPTAQWDGDSELLELAMLDQRGTVDLGIALAHPEAATGISGNATLAEVRFTRTPFTGTTTRSASVALTSESIKPHLFLDHATTSLSWNYNFPGDYNQDGLVDIMDITEVASRWGQRGNVVGYHEIDGVRIDEYGFPHNTAIAIVDGDADGVITISDITTIAMNYGALIQRFNVYGSLDPDADMPVNPGDPSTTFPIASVSMTAAQGNPVSERLCFNVEIDMQDNTYFWVRPANDDTEGIPSSTAMYYSEIASVFSIEVQPETYIFPDFEIHPLDDVGLVFSDDNGLVVVDVWLRGADDVRCFAADLTFDATQFHFQGGLLYVPDDTGTYVLEEPAYTSTVHIVATNKVHMSYHNISSGSDGNRPAFRLSFAREAQPEFTPIVGGWQFPGKQGYSTGFRPNYVPITQMLTWFYNCDLDGDQDGYFSGADEIAMVALYFNTLVDDYSSAASLADYNHDGMVNISDVTIIAQNWGMPVVVTGYNVYAATDVEDAPGGANWINETTPPVAPIGSVTLKDDALGELFVDRLHFNFRIDNPEPGMWLWVMPVAYDTVGGVPDGLAAQIPEA